MGIFLGKNSRTWFKAANPTVNIWHIPLIRDFRIAGAIDRRKNCDWSQVKLRSIAVYSLRSILSPHFVIQGSVWPILKLRSQFFLRSIVVFSAMCDRLRSHRSQKKLRWIKGMIWQQWFFNQPLRTWLDTFENCLFWSYWKSRKNNGLLGSTILLIFKGSAG